MSSALSSRITPLTKQRTSVMADCNGLNKIKKLRQMIDALEREKKEYLKTNQHLTQNAQEIYEQNQILKNAINDRTVRYEHILDHYSRSTRTLQTAMAHNQKMTKIYRGYKNRANNAQKISDESVCCNEEIDKFDQEINDIQKSASDLFKKFYESEKKIFDYKVLLSLDSRLTKINKMFEKEADNCITKNPCFFSSSRLHRLQQKIEKGNEIKEELSLIDSQEEKERMEETEEAIKNFSEKLDRCLSIYNQILLINKKRSLMNDDNIDYNSSFSESSKDNSSKEKLQFDKVDFKCPKFFDMDVEINELKRIVGTEGFDYLNDSEREENDRRIKSLFIHGFNHEFCDSEASSESDESEKENNNPEKLLDSGDGSESEKEESLLSDEEQPENNENEKVNNANDKKPKLQEKEEEDNSLITKHLEKTRKDDHLIKDKNPEKEENSVKVKKENHLIKEKGSEDEETDESSLKKVNKDKNQLSIKVLQPLFVGPEKQPEKSNKSIQIQKDSDTEKSKKDGSTHTHHTHKDTRKVCKHRKSKKEDQESNNLENKATNTEKITKSKRTEKTEPPKSTDNKPYSLLVNPVKNKQISEKNQNKVNKEDENESEHLLEVSVEHSEITDNKEIPINNDQPKSEIKQPQKVEPTKPSANKSYSLLVYPDKNRKQTETKNIQKTTEESEITSEYILGMSENRSETTTNTEFDDQINQNKQDTKSSQTEKIESNKPSDNKPYSLLVHPNKNRQQTIINNRQKSADESGLTSEYLIEGLEELEDDESEDDKSEKAISTNNQTQDNIKSKQTEKAEPQSNNNKPYSLLVHPNKNRKQTTIYNQKSADESELASEHILGEFDGLLTTNSENQENDDSNKQFINSNLNQISIQKEKVKPSKQSTNKPYSLLVHPNKSKQQSFTTSNQKSTEDSEITSEYILGMSECQSEITNTEVDDQINQNKQDTKSNKTKQTEKIESNKPSDNKPYSLLVHPNKNRQQMIINNRQKSAEESELTSEYLIEGLEDEEYEDDKSEKAISTNNQTQDNIKSKQTEKVEPQSNNNKPYSLLVHPNKNRKQTTIYNQKSTDESELASEYIIDGFEQLDSSNKSGFIEIASSSQQSFNSSISNPNKKPTKPAQKEQAKPTVKAPYSLLVHPNKSRQQSFINNQKSTDESGFTSEFILDYNVDEESEKTVSTENIILSNNQSQNNIKSKHEEKKIDQKSSVNKPYSLLVHPDKNRKQTRIKYDYKSADESGLTSEYLIEGLEELEDDESEDDKSEKAISTNNQTQDNRKSKQTEKAEPQSNNNKPYSLLVHPNKNKQQSLVNNCQKYTDESELASEYIIDGFEQLADSSKSDFIEVASSSQQSFNSSLLNHNKKTTQPAQKEQAKPTVKAPYSLLVHPNKSRQQSFINNQKLTDESEIASEYILEGHEDEESEKAVSTEKFILSNNKSQSNIKSKQEEKVESTKPPVNKPNSLLVHPNKSRQQSLFKSNQKSTDESEITSEYILDDLEEKQSEKAVSTEKFILSNIQSQDNIKPKQKESPNNKPYSLLVHPNKSKQQSSIKYSEKSNSDSFDSSFELVLEELEDLEELEEELEKELANEKFDDQLTQLEINIKARQTEKEEQYKHIVNAPYSRLVNPNKSRQQSFKKQNQKSTDESEIASEYILDGQEQEDGVSPNINSQNNIKSKQAEKVEPTQPYSLLVPPNKNKQKSLINNDQKSTDESEITSEFQLDKSEEFEQLENSSKSDFIEIASSSQQSLFSSFSSVNKKEEQKEPTKPTVKSPYSLLVNPNKSRQQSYTNHNQKSTDESEIESEFQLEGDEESEKAVTTEKFVLSNIKQAEKEIEPLIPNKLQYSLLVHPNKDKQQSVMIQYQKVLNNDEYILEDPDSEPETPKKKTEDVKAQITAKNSVIQKKKYQQKKEPRISTYDPSIFFNSSFNDSTNILDFEKSTEQIPLTVSLKDIGLEGFDTCNLEKMKELQRLQQLRIDEQKKQKRILVHVDKNKEKIDQISKSDMTCKLILYEKANSSQNKDKNALFKKKIDQSCALPNPKPASLLDSTQRAQKTQAIKPKTQQKTGQKMNKSNSSGFNNSYDEKQLNSLIYRSPRRFSAVNSDSDEGKESILL